MATKDTMALDTNLAAVSVASDVNWTAATSLLIS